MKIINNGKKLKYILFFIIIIFSVYNSLAQEDTVRIGKKKEKINFTGFFNYGMNFHTTDFKELPNYPNCCNSFKSGIGNGFEAGTGFQYWLGIKNYYWGAKVSFGNLNGLIKKTETKPVTVNGNLVDAKIDNNIDVSLNSINILPFAAYKISGISEQFFVSLGGKIGFPISANFAQYEQLAAPNVGTFENGYRTRNIRSGDLPNINNFLYGGTLGMFYELPLSSKRNLKLVPEFNINYWFNSPVKSLNWNVTQLTLGLGIRYYMPSQPQDFTAPPILPSLPPLSHPSEVSAFFVDVNYRMQNLKEEQTDFTGIVIEDFTYTNLKPLLNYIFFEENSVNIPQRYHLLTAEDTKYFNYKDLNRLNAFETYYHCLNIIGYRMREFATPTLELVGTNSNTGAEKDNIALSQLRAENVKKYLCDVWKIEPSRIKITRRNLPKEPTKSSEGISSIGDAENRRVEIYSSDNSITESILSFDTVSVLKSNKIHFMPEVQSSFGIETWKLKVGKDNLEVDAWEGKDNIPNEIIWNPENKINLFSKFKDLDYDLVVFDRLGQFAKSLVKSLPIKKISVASKRSDDKINDKDLEYYSLILFDFGSVSLDTRHNKIVDFVKSRIKPNSKVIISGYTDIIGQAEINKKIATDRAKAVERRLNFHNVEIRGIGKDELLYDNKYPEGRFYCRTVTISIETPITEVAE